MAETYTDPSAGRGDKRQNTTNYDHPQETNLLNIHKALQYRYLTGEPELRVNLGPNAFVISGNVLIPGIVQVFSDIDNPIHNHITEVGTSGNLQVPWLPVAGNVRLDTGTNSIGNVRITDMPGVYITNFPSNIRITDMPSITGRVTLDAGSNLIGNVSITQMPGITGNVGVSGNVDITRLPYVLGNVSLTGNLAAITQLPAITGNVGVSGNVRITDMPGVTGNVRVYGGNVIVTQGTTPWTVDGNVTINQVAGQPTLVKYINTPNNLQMDMTQRLRVSMMGQQWWYAPTVDKDGDLRDIESNVGASSGSAFVQNLASINMSSGTEANGSFIRISRRRHKMRPGVSMSAAFSINWNGYVPDGKVTKRVGVFTNYNGIFYEMTGDLAVVIRRRLTDGTLVEKRVTREQFNIDTLNGSGETGYDFRPVAIQTSAITAYVSKSSVAIPGDGTVYRVVFTVADPSQFFVSQKGRITGLSPTLYNGTVMVTAINGSNVTVVYNVDPGVFSSIGTGTFAHSNLHHQYTFGFDFNGNRATSVRFFIDGPLGRVAVHQENFNGETSTPFGNAPALSTRYEIFNSDAPGRLPNFTCSSETINVEAELELNPGFGIATNNTPVTYSKLGTATHPVLGIALRAGEPYQRSDLQLQGVTFADIANINQQNSGVFYWRLVLNPTIGGTVPASIDVGKSSRYWPYTAATTVSGGIDLLSGYSSSTQQFDVRTALNFVNLGSNIEYTDTDKIVLVVQQLVGGTADAQLVATINFIEAL